MGAYDRFKTAEIRGAGKFIDPGHHILLIKRAEMGPSKNPMKKNVEKTVIEMKVIESDTMEKGIACALVETDENPKGNYAGNVLAAVSGVLGDSPTKLQADPDFEATFEAVFGVEQILVGMLVDCVAQHNDTKTYTAKSWEAIRAEDYAKYGLIAPDGAYTGADDDDEAEKKAAE